MTEREIVLACIHHHETPVVPYSLPIEPAVEQRLDAYYGGPHWRDKLRTFMTGVAPVDTAQRVPVDETHARDTYGALWRVDQRPFHLEEPPLQEPALTGYEFPEPERFFVPGGQERARQTCAEHEDKFLIGHVGWGLFEVSWILRGFENVLTDVLTAPDFYEALLDKLTELYLAFVHHTAALPVDAIMFGDDWGDQRGVILGPDRWRRFLKPRWAKLYDAVHAHGKLVISHCCGSCVDILPDAIEIGLDVLESVQPEAAGMNPYELKKRFGDKLTFFGGLGSQSTIPFGTPSDIHAEVRRLCSEMSGGGGYILAPAKPLQPETPTENAAAVVEAFAEQAPALE